MILYNQQKLKKKKQKKNNYIFKTRLKPSFFKKINLFNSIFWLWWIFVAVCGLSLFAVRQGLLFHAVCRASHCSGFSGHSGFSSCSSQALECCMKLWCLGLLLWGMWDLPVSGIKPVSLALQDRFLTTGPWGKPCNVRLKSHLMSVGLYNIKHEILFPIVWLLCTHASN